ncbi:MAG: AAA family ATPase, partial [Candidatus Eremiobacterota bacterium]
MIPVSLQLKNFMSYGEPPLLDFRDFHMACLCGNNGHGKSAIIDAITWALWGEGRKASIEKKPDEGLLRIGKTEMTVEFVFDVEGDRYRVIRNYSKSGKTSKSSLEFDIYSPRSEEYTGLTQKSVTLTQEKINQFLRMDYETFINSCVLLQGRADEFATKKAGERKQLLADIMGLSRYDELSTMAREKYKEANMRVTLIEEEKEKLAEEIFQKENVLERLEDIKTQLETLNKEIEDTEKELLSMRDKKSKLSVIREQLTEMEQQAAREKASLKDLKKQETHLTVDRERIEKIVTEEKNIMEQCHNYEDLIREEASMVEKLQKTTGLKQKKYSLENKIHQKRNEITSEIKIFLEKINSIKIQ